MEHRIKIEQCYKEKGELRRENLRKEYHKL